MKNKAKILFKGSIPGLSENLVIYSSEFNGKKIVLEEGAYYYLTQAEMDQVSSNAYDIIETIPPDTTKIGSVDSSIVGSVLSSVVTMQNSVTAIGTGTILPTNGYGVASISISGTFVATIIFEGQGPDGGWYTINSLKRGSGIISNIANSTGLYEINTRALIAVRANITSYTSGSITIKGQAQPLTTGTEFVNSNATIVSSNIIQPVDIQSIYRALQYSTTTVLGNNGVYTGASIDCSSYSEISGKVVSDQSGTLTIQESDDNLVWDTVNTIQIPAGTSTTTIYNWVVASRYVRIVYTNGGTTQTTFRLSAYASVLGDGKNQIQITAKKSITIQTHNAVSIAASLWSTPTSNPTNSPFTNSNGWIDTNGYDFLGMTVMNDATSGIKVNVVWSNDGANKHGETSGIINVPASTNSTGDGIVQTRARYAKLSINNIDTTASHTMSAWVYLKA